MPGSQVPSARGSGPRRAGAVAFFDLDKTIIAGSSALAFGRPFLRHGLITRGAALRSMFAQLTVLMAGADADTVERLRARISALCTGWEVTRIAELVAESLHEIVEPMVYAEATELMAVHRAAGDEIVVLSASGVEVVGPIAEMVGADRCVATRMAVVDGRYTGEIAYYCYGPEKAVAAAGVAAERGCDLASCHAYTDSITDLPLLEAVGHPTAVNPDRALRRVAAERGWPVLEFGAPVPLRSRVRPVARPLAVVALVGLTVALALGRHLRRSPDRVATATTPRA